MTAKVYIDGHVGTTGIRIREWLTKRRDLEVVTLPEQHRKDETARRDMLWSADVSILCLPDDAAREVALWVGGEEARLIDASTAHRVDDDWVFGLAELSAGQRTRIAAADRVSNPGCYASAFLLLVRPLIDAGAVPLDVPLSIHALSGYSGGGRALVERWEDPGGPLVGLPYEAPYAYERVHKHVPEMTKHSGLSCAPQFLPSVGPFYCGMRVQVPLHARVLAAGWSSARIHDLLCSRYRADPFVNVKPMGEDPVLTEGTLDPRACNETNRIDIHVIANPAGHLVLVAVLDNLGKGACGMAIQSLNLMLGVQETTGLAS